MPIRAATSDDGEARQWPTRLRTRQPRHSRGFEPQHQVLSPTAVTSDFVVVTGGRRSLEQPDHNLPSGCEEDDLSDALPADSADDSDTEAHTREPIQPNAYLRAGMVFEGHQRVCLLSAGTNSVKEEQWDVNVSIQDLDLEKGSCSGFLRLASPTEQPVTTYWEGEIIDDINHSFVTCKWGASYILDMSHWRKFSSFGSLRKRVTRLNGRCYKLHEMPVIFMRWKEVFFMGDTKEDYNLTIAGFYYICLCRSTGSIQGYYFDPSSMPNQKLTLHPSSRMTYHAGFTFV